VVGSFEKLAYDVPADLVDEVVRIAESIMIGDFHHFVHVLVVVYLGSNSRENQL
jgi:hypothetical protein